MLLTIGIGNTVVLLGVFDGDRRIPCEYGLQLVNLLRLRSIDPAAITAACLCSGVPLHSRGQTLPLPVG